MLPPLPSLTEPVDLSVWAETAFLLLKVSTNAELSPTAMPGAEIVGEAVEEVVSRQHGLPEFEERRACGGNVRKVRRADVRFRPQLRGQNRIGDQRQGFE